MSRSLCYRGIITALTLIICLGSPGMTAGVTEREPNDRFEDAQAVSLPVDIQGTAESNIRERDYYTFSVPAAGMDSFAATLFVNGRRDLKMVLYSGSGSEMNAADHFSAGRGEYLTVLTPPPGVYVLLVETKTPKKEESGGAQYTLSLNPVTATDDASVRTALHKALDYLLKNQLPTGAFTGAKGEGAGVTGLAVQAFLGAECLERDDWPAMYRSLDYLQSLVMEPGSFGTNEKLRAMYGGSISSTKNLDMMYEHGIGLITLIEAYALGVDGRLPEIIRNGLDFLYRAQITRDRPALLQGPVSDTSTSYGGWRYTTDAQEGDLSVSGWQIIAMIAAEKAGFDISPERKTAALNFVRGLFLPDSGSFGYRPTYMRTGSSGRAGMGALCMQLLGAGDTPEISAAIRYMFDKAPAWGGEYNGNYPFYYWYYGTRAAYLAGGDTWDMWSRNMCSLLVRHQNPDGSWNAFANEQKKVSNVYVTALGALILEYCCGSVPVYMRTGAAPPRPTAPPKNEISVEILDPIPNTRVSGITTVSADPRVPDRVEISRVLFYLDDQLVGERFEAPWEHLVDFGPGVTAHTVRVVAENNMGSAADATVNTRQGMDRISVRIHPPGKRMLWGEQSFKVAVTAHADSPLKELVVKVDDTEIYRGQETTVSLNHDFGTDYDHTITADAVNVLNTRDTETFTGKIPPPLVVTLTATVTDPDNTPIHDLTQADFAISEDTVPQTILRFSRETTNLSMVVVLDTSGSIRRAMPDVQDAAAQFIEQIQPDDAAAVMAFSDSVSILQPFTPDVNLLKHAVRQTRASGGTALYDAVDRACLLLKSQKGRKSVILLTDGKDENKRGNGPGSRLSFEQAMERVRETGVTVYTLGLGKNVARDVLEEMAAESGGRAYFPPTARDLQDVYRRIAMELRSQYVMEYAATNRTRNGQWRKLSVTVPDRNVIVRSKTGYFAR